MGLSIIRNLGDTPVIDIPDYTVINTTETPAQTQSDTEIANLLGPQTNTPLPAPMVQKSGVITTDLTKQGIIPPTAIPTATASSSSISKYVPYAVVGLGLLFAGMILLRHKKTVRHARVAYQNPRHKKEPDLLMADTLYEEIRTDGNIYRQLREPMEKNLLRKVNNKTYDYNKSIIMFKHLVDDEARRHQKEYGYTIDTPTREVVAKMFASDFYNEYVKGK